MTKSTGSKGTNKAVLLPWAVQFIKGLAGILTHGITRKVSKEEITFEVIIKESYEGTSKYEGKWRISANTILSVK
jgi:hypothetical protein